MTNWRPTSNADVAARRAALLRRLRQYFDDQQVLEVDTPALSAAASSDVQLESFEVSNSVSATPLFLYTSPEFCMKRLLASGYPDIYSICRVFRDAESGRHHQPEFTLLEWYRRDFDLNAIIADTLNVIALALEEPTFRESATILDYRDAFAASVGIDPISASVSELADAARADTSLREALGDERDDWLDLLLTSKVAPTFAKNRLTVLRHYPASQAALAQLCPADATVADRFEIFKGPIELANGYVELGNAAEQTKRIASEQWHRERRGRRQRPSDQNLVAALEAGLPSCSGVAVGIERLHMIHENTDDIRNVICFAFEGYDEQVT
jgi:lysyl-tRNA synthetase class 2